MTSNISDLVKEEERIDALRFKAFKTNKPEDREEYFKAASLWFQRRHDRRMQAEQTEPVVEVKEGYAIQAYIESTYDPVEWVDLSEALTIRTADEVRKGALEEAAQLVENNTPAQSNKWLGMKLTKSHYLDETAKAYSEGIRALIDTPAAQRRRVMSDEVSQ